MPRLTLSTRPACPDGPRDGESDRSWRFDCCHGVAREGRLWLLCINPSPATNMPGTINPILPLDMVAHIIQVALTPVFLLSGIATLLNVFSTRLARVADRVDQITKGIEEADAGEVALLAGQLSHLRRRSLALDAAVLLAAFGGAATCASVLTLFVGALRDATSRRSCSRLSASPCCARSGRSDASPRKC